MSYKLTYFNCKGTAESIRMLLKVAKVDFEDNRLEWDDSWTNKHKETYPWGTLPVLEHDNQILCHHVPISRFLARKFNLAGKNEFEAAKCDEFVESMQNLRDEAMKVFVEFDEDKKELIKSKFLNITAPNVLKRFEGIIQGKKWFVGDQMTWADIYIAYSFDFLESALREEVLTEAYPALVIFKRAVYDVPEVKDWLDSRPEGTY